MTRTNAQAKQTPASIAHHIRLHVYVSNKNPWDGISKGDKMFERIRGMVERVKKDGKTEKYEEQTDSIRRLYYPKPAVGK